MFDIDNCWAPLLLFFAFDSYPMVAAGAALDDMVFHPSQRHFDK
jgi:hypothetical protein